MKKLLKSIYLSNTKTALFVLIPSILVFLFSPNLISEGSSFRPLEVSMFFTAFYWIFMGLFSEFMHLNISYERLKDSCKDLQKRIENDFKIK